MQIAWNTDSKIQPRSGWGQTIITRIEQQAVDRLLS